MDKEFEWIDFYTKFADVLLDYKENRTGLIDKIVKAYSNINIELPRLEFKGLPKDIDPFTVYGLFNKGNSLNNRVAIIKSLMEEFNLNAIVPDSFDGIPVLIPMKATYYAFSDNEKRNKEDIDNLWGMFSAAICLADGDNVENRNQFGLYYDKVIKQYGVNWNLTMGLFWIRPYYYINLDSRNKDFLSDSDNTSNSVVNEMKSLKRMPKAEKYLEICDECRKVVLSKEYSYNSLPELSHVAWLAPKKKVSNDEFWPSTSEYPVDLSKEDWISFINDVEYPNHKGAIRVLKCYLAEKGISSSKTLSEKYNGHPSVYTGSINSTCARALKYFEMESYVDVDSTWKFPIAFQGRKGTGDEKGTYIYRMRDELMEALSEIDLSSIELDYNPKSEVKENLVSMNRILYGPPGTGKTYGTIIHAVSIIENKPIDDVYQESKTNYDDVKLRYDSYRRNGRIAFTTFHQSYGYEEFIEGIKPRMSEDEEGSELEYSIESGVFKEFCERAQTPKQFNGADYGFNNSPTVWKVSLGGTYANPVREECLNNGHIRIGWDGYGPTITDDIDYTFGGKKVLGAFMNRMKIGDIILSCYSASTIDAIGVVTGDYEWDDSFDKYKRVRKVDWIVKGINEDIVELNGGSNMTLSTIYRLRIPVNDILQLIGKVKNGNSDNTKYSNDENYVFIIDEINRGNISKIFGELITLIETTKRIGEKEEMTVRLPYSGDIFGVPNNVYIIGTMNTADRSIALMDTALRRRFSFEEMMPDIDVLRSIGADKVEDLDVAVMLKKINDRITFLYDREHTIGHAFFTGLKDEPTIAKLSSIFSKAVIPLLQEYFYEDYQKIQMVLGDNDKSNDSYKFIKETSVVAKDIFKGNVDDIIDLTEKRYEINEEALKELESYKQII